MVLVLTTFPEGADVEAVARTLVEERLAACVQVSGPLVSVYRWQGAIEREQERQMVVKTTRERLPALEARLLALHPYDVPECVVLAADGGSAAYFSWVDGETRAL